MKPKITRRTSLAMVGTFVGLLELAAVSSWEQADAFTFIGGQAQASGGTTTLTPWTVVNNTGSPMTNVPIEIYLPFSPTIDPIGGGAGLAPFASTDAVYLVDADGTTQILCQEDNRSSDLTPDVRGLKLSAILPSLAASTTKQLTVKKISNTTPQTGTDCTVAEVIAAAAEPCLLTMAYKDGNTYTASAAAGLQASGSWTDKTTAWNGGKWRGNGNGGYVTEYKVFCPFSRSGGTIFTQNNLGAWFCVSAFKAQSGAVSGGNPIIGVSVKYYIECGWTRITPSTAAAHWFDLTATSGTNTQSWVGSSPAKILTLSQTGNGYADATVLPGGTTWTQNSVGMVIDDGTGTAMIVGYTNAETVRVYIGKPMSSTTIASGSWRMFGLNHEYASTMPQQEIWFGGSLAWTDKPNIYSHLGTAWNGTSGGPFTYFSNTRSLLPFTTPASSITNSLTNINAQGTNPTGMGQGNAADLALYMPTTGGRDDIAPVLGYHVGALIKFDSNAWTKIFANGLKLTLAPYNFRDDNTGKAMLFNNGTDWVYEPPTGSSPVPRTSTYYFGNYNISDWTPQTAHHPNAYHVPFLLTGDYFWADKMQQQLFWLWTTCPNGVYGPGLNRGFCQSSEQRGNGWNFRDIFITLMMTPDRNPSMLGYSRSHIQSLYDNQFTYTGSNTIGVNPTPGLNITSINNTGSGKHYATSGYRYIGSTDTAVPDGDRSSLWQTGYGVSGFFLGKCMGMISSYADSFMTWVMEGVVGYSADPAVNLKWLVPIYYFDLKEQNGGAFVNDWTNIYRVSAGDLSDSGSGLARRLVTGTGISVSGLNGNALTINMPAGYFDAGGTAFYTNGIVRDLSAASFQSAPMSVASRVGFDPYAFDVDVGTSSNNHTVPTNAGTIKVWNRGFKTIYIKLTVGAGTATTGDQAIAPGAYGKATVGANTYLNYIAAAGAGTPLATVFGSVGAGYVNGDTITGTINSMSGFTINTAPVLTVNDTGVAGDVVDVSITTSGLFTANSIGATGGDTFTQSSTSGVGTGFTYRSASPVRYGTGFITAVNTSTHVVTIDNTINMVGPQGEVQYGTPFAQTALTTNRIQTAAPAVGDADGAAGGGNATLPTPYSGQNEYWTIQYNCAKLADVFGYTNGATARAAIAAAYTGAQELKWRVVN